MAFDLQTRRTPTESNGVPLKPERSVVMASAFLRCGAVMSALLAALSCASSALWVFHGCYFQQVPPSIRPASPLILLFYRFARAT